MALFKHALRHFRTLIGNISLAEVNAEHFDRYKGKRLTDKTEVKKNPRPRSVASVNVELNMLRAAFGTAKRWGLVERNPFTECMLCPVPQQTASFFTPEDFNKLIVCTRERWLRDVVLFAALTGMRRGEILNLRWRDVDLSRRLVTVQSSPTFKTKAGRMRIVPLNETALIVVRSRHGLSASELVFTKNDEPIDQCWLTHAFKKAVIRANLPPTLHFHSLRHYAELGIRDTLLPLGWFKKEFLSTKFKKLLGHTTPQMTALYIHMVSAELHTAVNRIVFAMN